MTHKNLPNYEDTDTDPAVVLLLIQGRREDVSDEAYADTVGKILYRLFDGDYISPNETVLCEMLPELRGQPVVTSRHVSPAYLDFLLNHEISARDYPIIHKYLAIKIANLSPLSATEAALLPKFADLDDFRAVTVAVTPELLQKAAANLDAMNADEQHAITHYLTDKIMDEESLTTDEMALLSLIAPEGMADGEATENGDMNDYAAAQTRLYEPPMNHPDVASLEYGYDIYEYGALLKRLQEHLTAVAERESDITGSDVLPLPLDYREIRVIKRIWGFDPTFKSQIDAVLL